MSAGARSLPRRALYWLPSLAYMGAIWAISAQSLPFELPQLPLRDKLAHAIEYGVLALLNLWALRRSTEVSRLGGAALAVGLTSLWGYLDEIHQAFVPGRNADLNDWIADTIGALLAIALTFALARARSRRQAAS